MRAFARGTRVRPTGALLEMARRAARRNRDVGPSLAVLLARDARLVEAVSVYAPLLRDSGFVRSNLEQTTQDVTRLAAAGAESALLETLRGSPTALDVAPCVAALEILVGEEPLVPAEVRAVAEEIAEKARRMRAEGSIWAAEPRVELVAPLLESSAA